jgi:thiosulfate/3-mercaptopyruvate sulfurtransferase
MAAQYAHPETLVSTDWVAQHLHDPNVRVIEVDPDTTAYEQAHIPGAVGMSCNEDGTFKSPEELKALYEGRGVTANQDTIAYCRIGERSSLTWYVLKYLLGYPNVKNYDGSWTEWGNLIEAPIEK